MIVAEIKDNNLEMNVSSDCSEEGISEQFEILGILERLKFEILEGINLKDHERYEVL